MVKHNLFELVRKEEVVLWAGAGLSIYAGYPSGAELKMLIYNDLNETVRSQIDRHQSLMDIAEMYLRSKNYSRNELNALLDRVFRSTPRDTSVHDILVKIPQIKTIITTNYDNLFEQSYRQRGRSIHSSNQIADLGKNEVEIFKAHGDLSNKDTLIIAKSDYERFFKENSGNNLLWNSIRDRMARNSVVFIGYTLEDSNVSVLFDKITEELKYNRKQVFLVAPGLSPLNINYLLSKNIQYIDSTGEIIIKELFEELHDNIIEDFKNNKISAHTLDTYLQSQNISANISINGGSKSITSVIPSTQEVKGTLKFSLLSNDTINKSLREYISGEKIGVFEVPAEKILKSEIRIGKTKIFENIGSFTIKSIPSGTYFIVLRFIDNFEIEIEADIYKTLYGIKMIVRKFNSTIDVEIDFDDKRSGDFKCNFNFTHTAECVSVKQELEVFTLLSKLSKGDRFTVFHDNKSIFNEAVINIEPLYKQFNSFRIIFECLRGIEHHYNIIFSPISYEKISDELAFTVSEVYVFIKKYHLKENLSEDFKIPVSTDSIKRAEDIDLIENADKTGIRLTTKKTYAVDIFEHTFNLGYLNLEIKKPKILNLKRLQRGLDDFVLISGKSKNAFRYFTATPDSVIF